MKEKKIVSLYDIHVPLNIPLDPVFEFIKDWRPTHVNLGGDVHDFGAVSHWVADQSRALDHGTIMENYRELKIVVLLPLKRVAPEAQIIYLKGNHEGWVDYASAICPNGRGYWEVEKNLRGYGIRFVPVGESWEASQHLHYIHGQYTNLHHAEKTVRVYGTNIFYGHTHDVQVHTNVRPLHQQPEKAQSCGCLCNRNPSYMKGKPNHWVHAFNYAYVNADGTFQDHMVNIINGAFIAEGRRYK